jgi:hypothetical protein
MLGSHPTPRVKGTTMKEFLTAAKHAEAEDNGDDGAVPFKIKNEDTGEEMVCRAYKPGDGQFAVLMATTSRHSSQQEQIAGIINFFASVLDDDSHHYVVSRLLDRRDPFGIEQVQGIMEFLIEEWSGRPTQSSSGSTRLQSSGGQNSTQPTPALT